jgi:hypothetical protein
VHVVIDAQIVKGYYEESVLGIKTILTSEATKIFDRLGHQDRTYLDDRGHIEHEWKQPVEPEWFNAWFAELLINDAARRIPVDTCYELRQQLEKFNFPTKGKEGKDFWYIRTARAVAQLTHNNCSPRAIIISEDIDFHEPVKKGNVKSNERIRILLSGQSAIINFLSKKENIHVCCIANYLILVTNAG